MIIEKIKNSIDQIIWWLCWYFFVAAVVHQYGFDWYLSFADSTVMLLLLLFTSCSTYFAFNKFQKTGNRFFVILWNIALSLISVFILSLVLRYIYIDDLKYLSFLDASIIVRFTWFFIMNLLVTVIYGLQANILEQKKLEAHNNDNINLMKDAELSGLRLQLQPHFLFNSLNSINALIGTEPAKARSMVLQLSEFLRGTLQRDNKKLITLEEEVNHLKIYLEIEKVRFGHRLITQIEIPENCLNLLVPPLILQPIVENAIKFGLYDTTGQVTISLQVSCNDSHLKIVVTNPFDPDTAASQKGTGFGLDAVQRRLYLLYARNDLLKTEKANNIFLTQIDIPQI
jgi:sensor histidine kinase YesM